MRMYQRGVILTQYLSRYSKKHLRQAGHRGSVRGLMSVVVRSCLLLCQVLHIFSTPLSAYEVGQFSHVLACYRHCSEPVHACDIIITASVDNV